MLLKPICLGVLNPFFLFFFLIPFCSCNFPLSLFLVAVFSFSFPSPPTPFHLPLPFPSLLFSSSNLPYLFLPCYLPFIFFSFIFLLPSSSLSPPSSLSCISSLSSHFHLLFFSFLILYLSYFSSFLCFSLIFILLYMFSSLSFPPFYSSYISFSLYSYMTVYPTLTLSSLHCLSYSIYLPLPFLSTCTSIYFIPSFPLFPTFILSLFTPFPILRVFPLCVPAPSSSLSLPFLPFSQRPFRLSSLLMRPCMMHQSQMDV